VLTVAEVERILAVPVQSDALGLRDRAMMEVLYATGVRRTELSRLRVDDVDVERMTLMVRQGKGKKDRVVPLGERAMAWVRRYLDHVRPELVTSETEHGLFVGTLGEPMCPGWVTERVRRYVEKSGIGKKGACHLFRHTMATLMLEGGADVRYVQEMLGHATIETTQLYTQVSIQKLREVHAATHPGARLGPAKTRIVDEHSTTEETEAELFSSLAAEAAEEEDLAS
jgi:integrase/recombinase XerD